MKTLACNVLVDENHTAVVHLPDEISPGQHTLLIVLQDQNTTLRGESPETFPTIITDQWPEELSLRREDMYDDQGR